MKKSIAILLSVIMLLSCVSVISASAADTTATVNVAGSDASFAKGDTLVYSVKLKTANPIVNGQFYLDYPANVLSIQEVNFPVVGSTMVYNYTENSDNLLSFNFSKTSSLDFTGGAVLANVYFKVTNTGAGAVPFKLNIEAMSSLGSDLILKDEIEGSTVEESIRKLNTKVTVKVASTKIKLGATTTVKATVTDQLGKTTFKSSDSKIASVSSTGKVKGIKAGSVKITATNNGKSASVTIKVEKKAQTMKVATKAATAKVSALKKKAATVAPIKVTKNQGKVTYKKVSGKAQLTINKTTGKVTVKKGTKKGKYTAKIKVTAAGNATYASGSKTVTITVNVK